MAISREEMLEEARKKLKAAYLERDRLLVHTVNSIGELDRSINLLFERLAEWYGVYFPELKLAEPEKYCKNVLMFDRKNLEMRTLAEVVGEEKAEEIIAKAKRSVGGDFGGEDMKGVRALANEIASMHALRNSLDEYQTALVKEMAPNLCYLVEPALAAKLIAQAGGLKRLTTFPASTVQLLGAEKALFRHLKRGTLPPKYGLIFQFPLIGNAQPAHRGKLARALATKLCIATKADAYSHNFIAKKLKEDFDKRAAEILKLPGEKKAKPGYPQRPQAYQQRPQGYGQRPSQGRPQERGRPRFQQRGQQSGRPQPREWRRPRWKKF